MAAEFLPLGPIPRQPFPRPPLGLRAGSHRVKERLAAELFSFHRILPCTASLVITELRYQRTLQHPATVTGFGYWSGRNVRVEFRPAPPNTGLVFVRGDLTPPRRIAAAVALRTEVPRRTVLTADGTRVEMVEHVLAALAGLKIDNCEIWIDGAELPGCDGSSLPFVGPLLEAGAVDQSEHRARLIVQRTVRVGDPNAWVEARPSANGEFRVAYHLDYGPGPIGQQAFELAVTPESFARELAPARTFILQHEAEQLLKQGLAQRASLSDLLVYGENGPLGNALRFTDECVRHKTLDLVGDLALSGFDLVGEFRAHRSGHRLNAELVSVLLREAEPVTALRRTA